MANKNSKTITLPKAIEVEEGEAIKEIAMREPMAGEMRGLKFTDLIQGDVDAMVVLIPRISKLTERQMLNMPTVNFAPLIGGVIDFFVEEGS